MTAETVNHGTPEPHPTNISTQIFKAQRVASRRLTMQFLYAVDAWSAALQSLEQELAKFPQRIEEARQAQFLADHTPPPVDEEGNPMPVVRPTALLSDQLAAQQRALEEFLETERPLSPLSDAELQEAFFTLAEELWPESVPVMAPDAPVFAPNTFHHLLRKGWSRARNLLAFLAAHREEIDQQISQAAQNWRLERMSCVDRNILRAAAGELQFAPSVNAAIVINEAIEMAKDYGQQDSWRFVNGVLDRIRKDLASAPMVIDGSSPETPPAK